MQNMMQILQAFNQFKSNFTGDAKQEVMRLISSGQMSQQQLNQFQQMANQFQQVFNIK